eukprot:4575449-Pyramimonas_sp.AAC.1
MDRAPGGAGASESARGRGPERARSQRNSWGDRGPRSANPVLFCGGGRGPGARIQSVPGNLQRV